MTMMTEPELCEFIILFKYLLLIDLFIIFVNQTQVGTDLKYLLF